jgi:hypothetical protein
LTVSASTKSACWIDAIQKGKIGPSWYPMGTAPVAYGLWQKGFNIANLAERRPIATHRCCSMLPHLTKTPAMNAETPGQE